MKTSCVACLLFAAALGTGCESARESRIRQNSELFKSLDPFSQKLVRDGLFNIGFTAETVEMSLGKPDRKETRATDDGPTETWVYKNFLYSSLANLTVGARDPATQRGQNPRLPAGRGAGQSSSITPPAAPTVADVSAPPLATLLLELREGRVVGAHLDL